MGQKIHPGGLRVGIIHDWRSNWFTERDFSDYLIEDVGLLTADAGDIVFVPPGRWHRASWALNKQGGGQTDTRLSFNVSPNLFHNFGEDAGGKQ